MKRIAWNELQPGLLVEDRRAVRVSPGAAVGIHEIKIAVYEPSKAENLILYREGEVLPGGLLSLWILRVL